jgi:hypothetical protein
MIWYFIVRIIISIGILFILHNLYDYCKQNFTTKKTKDLVSLHKEKYQEILNELHNQTNVETLPDELTFQDKAFLQKSLLTMIQTSV